MIETAIAAWAVVPAWARRAIAGAGAALAIGLALLIWLHHHDAGVIDHHDAAVASSVASRAEVAGSAAASVVASAQTETETSNAKARAAADSSDDPLRAGLDSLRARQAGAPRAAAR